MKQTAVEWLIEQLYSYPIDDIVLEKINQAKAMEKEQIIFSNYNGQSIDKSLKVDISKMIRLAEQYYNETFKSE